MPTKQNGSRVLLKQLNTNIYKTKVLKFCKWYFKEYQMHALVILSIVFERLFYCWLSILVCFPVLLSWFFILFFETDELEKQSFCDLKVTNNSDQHVAFKVTLRLKLLLHLSEVVCNCLLWNFTKKVLRNFQIILQIFSNEN